jgi:subtilisin family serine protease
VRRRRVGGWALLAVAAVAAGAVTSVAGVGAAPAGAPPAAQAATGAAAAPSRWVTLVTGDRVLVRGDDARPRVERVLAAAGRERIAFHSYTAAGHVHLEPSDAAPLLRAQVIDPRLFDLTALLAFGYDDRSRPDLPLIVSYRGDRSAAPARARAGTAGGRISRELPAVDAVAVSQDRKQAAAYWANLTGAPAGAPKAAGTLAAGISHVWLDGRVRTTLDRSVPQIGAPAAWRAGHTGRDVTVAVLDTGIDATHPDLADAVVAARDFSGSATGTEDHVGHGTHVASIVTGSGAASAGRYAGVAPDARLVVGKVFDDDGFGAESAIIAGMQWATVEQHSRVVNMSLGTDSITDGTEPMDLAVNELTEQTGALFVVSAGNSGPQATSVSSPGAADAALTVGAVDRDDQLADFSSRGPRFIDDAIKPDITAPGVDIVAARAAGSELGEPVGAGYMRLSGTSMAAPHVAGAAAILAGQHPDWRAEQLKATLMASARPTPGAGVFDQGSGRVDVAAAITQSVSAAPASVSLGVARWPHTDDRPVTRTVTYRNTGAAPATLDLGLDIRGPDGGPAPAGMFRTDATRLTVPPGGTATATLTADTTVAGPDGTFSGALTATAPGGQVRTPVAITKEPERHDLTLTYTDRDGAPARDFSVFLTSLDTGESFAAFGTSGTTVVRLPKGAYLLDSRVDMVDGTGATQSVTVIVEPKVVVTGDTAMTFDARQGHAIQTPVDQADARPYNGEMTFVETSAAGPVGVVWLDGGADGMFVRPSQTAAPGAFTFTAFRALARPDGAGGFAGSPYAYHLQWSQDGRVPVPVHRFRDRDLVPVRTTIADAGGPPGTVVAYDAVITMRAPGGLTAFATPGVPDSALVLQYVPGAGRADVDLGRSRVFDRGTAPSERWNVGVFGPAFPGDGDWAVRGGDVLAFTVEMFTDAGADHGGESAVDEFTNVLRVNGAVVPPEPGTDWAPGIGAYRVPAEPATVRYETTARRSVSAFSTVVKAAWTFRSAHASESPPWERQSLAAVRFAPALDDRNRAPSGKFDLPVSIQRLAGGRFGRSTGVTVDVSYDDGKTWQRAPLAGGGDSRVAHLVHPRTAGFVSLRATATDRAGNSVEETVIRAYAVRK